MLEPQTRAALTEQLRPPTGFELVHAIGTTFTLDLTTALSIPLSFAANRIAESSDPIGILDAVRRVSDRIDIFAQAGAISMSTRSDLVAFLEPMIHPVTVQKGLFHPKVWLLEYSDGEESRFRFVCASRNLTTDRSWDVVVRLDGWVAGERYRDHAATVSPPLAAFLRALPGLALRAMDSSRRQRILDLADRVRTIAWETPDDLRDLAFHPLGIPGESRPQLHGKRALILSPFLSDDGLAALRSGVRTVTHVVSRAESLDRLSPSSLDARLTCYILDDAATQLGDDESGENVVPPGERLVGLHAKAIVVDRIDGAHVVLGSANATGAAWGGNVEFMVELVGSVARFGVEATLQALGELKEEYPSEGGATVDADEAAELRLESALRRLSGVPLWARVLPTESYGMRVWAGEGAARESASLDRNGIAVRWHLLTRADLGGTGLGEGEGNSAELHGLELTDVTPFIVLVARDADGRERAAIQLALLLDDVDTRRDAIIARQLTDRVSFIRLITLMLDLAGIGVPDAQMGHGGAFFGSTGAGAGAGLFEALLRAVGDQRNGLADAKRVIDLVRSQGDDGDILPPGFEELWASVWDAHLASGGRA